MQINNMFQRLYDVILSQYISFILVAELYVMRYEFDVEKQS